MTKLASLFVFCLPFFFSEHLFPQTIGFGQLSTGYTYFSIDEGLISTPVQNSYSTLFQGGFQQNPIDWFQSEISINFQHSLRNNEQIIPVHFNSNPTKQQLVSSKSTHQILIGLSSGFIRFHHSEGEFWIGRMSSPYQTNDLFSLTDIYYHPFAVENERSIRYGFDGAYILIPYHQFFVRVLLEMNHEKVWNSLIMSYGYKNDQTWIEFITGRENKWDGLYILVAEQSYETWRIKAEWKTFSREFTWDHGASLLLSKTFNQWTITGSAMAQPRGKRNPTHYEINDYLSGKNLMQGHWYLAEQLDFIISDNFSVHQSIIYNGVDQSFWMTQQTEFVPNSNFKFTMGINLPFGAKKSSLDTTLPSEFGIFPTTFFTRMNITF